MSVITITTCLSKDLHAKIKQNGFKVPELIKLGYLAKIGNPQLLSRIRELEAINVILSDKLARFAKKLYNFELKYGDLSVIEGKT